MLVPLNKEHLPFFDKAIEDILEQIRKVESKGRIFMDAYTGRKLDKLKSLRTTLHATGAIILDGEEYSLIKSYTEEDSVAQF